MLFKYQADNKKNDARNNNRRTGRNKKYSGEINPADRTYQSEKTAPKSKLPETSADILCRRRRNNNKRSHQKRTDYFNSQRNYNRN